MKNLLLALFTLSMSFLQPALAADIRLVDKGNSSYIIYTPKHASAVEQFAAHELQKYVNRISGVPIPVEVGDGLSRGHGIYIGAEFTPLFGLKINSDYPGLDGFVMKSMNGNILLAGSEQRGTLYAVYDLLEEIGCRWYAPGFSFYGRVGGEFVPKLANINLPHIDKVARPSFKYRKIDVDEGWTYTIKNMKELIDWMAKARLNVFCYPMDMFHQGRVEWDIVRQALIPDLKKRGILVEVGQHGYPNFLPPEKYFKEHPDWFAEIDGKRTSDLRAVFNTSNKAALDTFTQNVMKYLTDHPEVDILDLWPPDNAEWSEDAQSLKQGSPSKRQAIILNAVARAAAKDAPHVKIEFIAYQTYLSPPENTEIDSNVVMDFCPIRQTFARPIWDWSAKQNVPYHEALLKWFKRDVFKGDIGIYSYYRRYIWRSLPVVIPNLIASEMRWYHSLGVTGMRSYSEPGDWFTYELQHYVIARLSWNVDVSIPSLVKEYCADRFGAAGPEVEKYFNIIEQTLPFQNRVAFNTTPSLEQTEDYLKNLKKCAQLLEDAEQKARAESDSNAVFLLHKLSLSLEYTTLDLKIGELSMRMAGAYVENGVERLEQLHSKMVGLFDTHLDEGIFISRGGQFYPIQKSVTSSHDEKP